MKKWEIINKAKSNPSIALGTKNQKSKIRNILKILLENRGIKTEKEVEEFLNPKLEEVTIENVNIDKKQVEKAIVRIKSAIKNKEQIIIYGDYDVDGICGTAILWETLDFLGAKVMPYIPHRIDEGYGLSIKGIENVKNKYKNLKLIITTDNGITAGKAVDFAKKNKIDVIITDHHTVPEVLPKALAIVHTTKLCGAGVAYLLAQEIKNIENNHLELVALATVADLVLLRGFNRTFLKFGLEKLRDTKRMGLLELLKKAGLEKNKLGVYEIGHIIAPRLNAMGRLEYAMDSLRLVCARNQKKAESLAEILGNTNRERQGLTLQSALHAIEMVKKSRLRQGFGGQAKIKNLLFVVHESYEQGIIGLIAGKLVEEFYKPAIVISKGKTVSKASARSVRGFDVIEFIRSASEFLIDAGGHPMAAGFTIETAKIPLLQRVLEDRAETLLDKDLLTRILRIDCELSLSDIDIVFYNNIQKLAPFGMGNPEPTFISRRSAVEDVRTIGMEGKHLKMRFRTQNSESIDAVAFGMGEMSSKIKTGDKIDIVYTIDRNEWNGEKRLQLKIRDFVRS